MMTDCIHPECSQFVILKKTRPIGLHRQEVSWSTSINNDHQFVSLQTIGRYLLGCVCAVQKKMSSSAPRTTSTATSTNITAVKCSSIFLHPSVCNSRSTVNALAAGMTDKCGQFVFDWRFPLVVARLGEEAKRNLGTHKPYFLMHGYVRVDSAQQVGGEDAEVACAILPEVYNNNDISDLEVMLRNARDKDAVLRKSKESLREVYNFLIATIEKFPNETRLQMGCLEAGIFMSALVGVVTGGGDRERWWSNIVHLRSLNEDVRELLFLRDEFCSGPPAWTLINTKSFCAAPTMLV